MKLRKIAILFVQCPRPYSRSDDTTIKMMMMIMTMIMTMIMMNTSIEVPFLLISFL